MDPATDLIGGVWSLVMIGVRIRKVLVSEDFLDVIGNIGIDAARVSLEHARDSESHPTEHLRLAAGHLEAAHAVLRQQLRLTDAQIKANPHAFVDPMERYWAVTYLLAMCYLGLGDKGIARRCIEDARDLENAEEPRFRRLLQSGSRHLPAYFNPLFWRASRRKGHNVFSGEYVINRQDPAAALKALKLKRAPTARQIGAWLSGLPDRARQLTLSWRRERDQV